MTRERVGAGAIGALVIAALFFLLQLAVLAIALFFGATGFTIFIPLVLSLPVSLAQTLVITPVWCAWLLARSQPTPTRRRRMIARALALSGATFFLTLWTWYLVYTAPYENLHIIPG